MKFSRLSTVACAATVLAFFASTAGAQLKPGAGSGLGQLPPAGAPVINVPPPSRLISGEAEKEAAGKLSAQGWLVLLDRRDWGTAWEASSNVFQSNVPLATWMDAIPKVRGAMGAFIERIPRESVYKTTLAGRPDGEYVSAVFVSKFDKGELEEYVTTVREPDGRWRVTGYSTK